MSADRAALLEAFRRRFGREAALVAEAPGRVNLIGEHTDYNEGHVLPLAIDRTVVVAAAPGGEEVRALAVDFGEEDAFSPANVEQATQRAWRDYVRGAVWALDEAGHALRGADLALSGDVPVGAGLSSSAALTVALVGAMAATSELRIEPLEVTDIARRAESGFVGVQCGVMDQLAAVFGREDAALLIDCRSLQTTPLPLPEGIAVAVVDSAVRRSLAGSPYNQRRRQCEEAAAALGVGALRDVTVDELERRRSELPETLYRRARHVVTEETRVLAAAEALRRGDAATLGRLMGESHESLRDDFEASCRELDLLVGLAARVEGVLGARLTGAGFGGCTVNLLREGAQTTFEREVLGAYRERTGLPAEMYAVRGHEGLRVSDA